MSSISRLTLELRDRAEVGKDPVADRRNKALMGLERLCCTNRGLSGLPLSPDGLILRAL